MSLSGHGTRLPPRNQEANVSRCALLPRRGRFSLLSAHSTGTASVERPPAAGPRTPALNRDAPVLSPWPKRLAAGPLDQPDRTEQGVRRMRLSAVVHAESGWPGRVLVPARPMIELAVTP